ncbi:MAG: hypothetical protein WC263_01715 [Candidatus Micrarchaeia archaeon]|jgi:hypothetical protein
MECKDCKVTCDGKEVAAISCGKDGFSVKCTDAGKELCKKFKGCC